MLAFLDVWFLLNRGDRVVSLWVVCVCVCVFEGNGRVYLNSFLVTELCISFSLNGNGGQPDQLIF